MIANSLARACCCVSGSVARKSDATAVRSGGVLLSSGSGIGFGAFLGFGAAFGAIEFYESSDAVQTILYNTVRLSDRMTHLYSVQSHSKLRSVRGILELM